MPFFLKPCFNIRKKSKRKSKKKDQEMTTVRDVTESITTEQVMRSCQSMSSSSNCAQNEYDVLNGSETSAKEKKSEAATHQYTRQTRAKVQNEDDCNNYADNTLKLTDDNYRQTNACVQLCDDDLRNEDNNTNLPNDAFQESVIGARKFDFQDPGKDADTSTAPDSRPIAVEDYVSELDNFEESNVYYRKSREIISKITVRTDVFEIIEELEALEVAARKAQQKIKNSREREDAGEAVISELDLCDNMTALENDVRSSTIKSQNVNQEIHVDNTSKLLDENERNTVKVRELVNNESKDFYSNDNNVLDKEAGKAEETAYHSEKASEPSNNVDISGDGANEYIIFEKEAMAEQNEIRCAGRYSQDTKNVGSGDIVCPPETGLQNLNSNILSFDTSTSASHEVSPDLINSDTLRDNHATQCLEMKANREELKRETKEGNTDYCNEYLELLEKIGAPENSDNGENIKAVDSYFEDIGYTSHSYQIKAEFCDVEDTKRWDEVTEAVQAKTVSTEDIHFDLTFTDHLMCGDSENVNEEENNFELNFGGGENVKSNADVESEDIKQNREHTLRNEDKETERNADIGQSDMLSQVEEKSCEKTDADNLIKQTTKREKSVEKISSISESGLLQFRNKRSLSRNEMQNCYGKKNGFMESFSENKYDSNNYAARNKKSDSKISHVKNGDKDTKICPSSTNKENNASASNDENMMDASGNIYRKNDLNVEFESNLIFPQDINDDLSKESFQKGDFSNQRKASEHSEHKEFDSNALNDLILGNTHDALNSSLTVFERPLNDSDPMDKHRDLIQGNESHRESPCTSHANNRFSENLQATYKSDVEEFAHDMVHHFLKSEFDSELTCKMSQNKRRSKSRRRHSLSPLSDSSGSSKVSEGGDAKDEDIIAEQSESFVISEWKDNPVQDTIDKINILSSTKSTHLNEHPETLSRHQRVLQATYKSDEEEFPQDVMHPFFKSKFGTEPLYKMSSQNKRGFKSRSRHSLSPVSDSSGSSKISEAGDTKVTDLIAKQSESFVISEWKDNQIQERSSQTDNPSRNVANIISEYTELKNLFDITRNKLRNAPGGTKNPKRNVRKFKNSVKNTTNNKSLLQPRRKEFSLPRDNNGERSSTFLTNTDDLKLYEHKNDQNIFLGSSNVRIPNNVWAKRNLRNTNEIEAMRRDSIDKFNTKKHVALSAMAPSLRVVPITKSNSYTMNYGNIEDFSINEVQKCNRNGREVTEDNLSHFGIGAEEKDTGDGPDMLDKSKNKNLENGHDISENAVYESDSNSTSSGASEKMTPERKRILDATRCIRSPKYPFSMYKNYPRSRTFHKMKPILIKTSKVVAYLTKDEKNKCQIKKGYKISGKCLNPGGLKCVSTDNANHQKQHAFLNRATSPHDMKAKFDDLFKKYAGKGRSNSDLISYKRSTEWLRDAGVVGNTLTAEEANDVFKCAAGVKIVLNKGDYRHFLNKLTRVKRLNYYEIYQKLCDAKTYVNE